MTPRVDQRDSNGNMFTNARILVSTRSRHYSIPRNLKLLVRKENSMRTPDDSHQCTTASVEDLVSHGATRGGHGTPRSLLRSNTELPTQVETHMVATRLPIRLEPIHSYVLEHLRLDGAEPATFFEETAAVDHVDSITRIIAQQIRSDNDDGPCHASERIDGGRTYGPIRHGF